MKMLCDKLLILLVLISLKNVEAYFGPDNSELSLGDSCELENNVPGICEELQNCESAKKLFDMKRTSELSRCQFIGKRPTVCCPLVQLGINIKETKFTRALCKDLESEIEITDNILNGRKAGIGEFPYQVALGYREAFGSELDFKCGGSLIAEDIVLTAAHCANRVTELPVMVRLGRTSLNLKDDDDDTPVVDVEVEKVKIHSQYSRTTRQNDIALIKLKKPVKYTKFLKPICLSSKSSLNPEQNLTITGYGTINTDTRARSDWLLKGDVNEYPFTKCQSLYSPKFQIVDTQFCAQSTLGVDACQGDSGGPMMYEENHRKYIFGITSYGNGCGTVYPGIYTRVDKFLSWIETEMTALG